MKIVSLDLIVALELIPPGSRCGNMINTYLEQNKSETLAQEKEETSEEHYFFRSFELLIMQHPKRRAFFNHNTVNTTPGKRGLLRIVPASSKKWEVCPMNDRPASSTNANLFSNLRVEDDTSSAKNITWSEVFERRLLYTKLG